MTMSGEDETDFVESPETESSEKVASKSQITTRAAAKKAEQGETSEKEVNNSDKMEIEKKADESNEAELSLAQSAAGNKEKSAEKSAKNPLKRWVPLRE